MPGSRSIGSLQVSAIGLGCNQFGTVLDEAASTAVIHAALDHGVTFFDTAEEYGGGESERVLGRALGARRNKVCIATKFGSRNVVVGNDRRAVPPGEGGASARWIPIAVERSLRQLGTDTIDLYQLHFPDPDCAIDETLSALDKLVKAGKVREFGCCNFSGAQIDEAAAAAGRGGLRRFASAQNRLSLLRQEALDDVVPACERYAMRLLPYFPLASGLLTGKYRRGEPPPRGTRFAENVPPEAAKKILSEQALAKVDALEQFARARGRGVLDLAIAWLVAQPEVGSVIAGATRPEQVAANARAAEWRLSPAEAAEAARLGR
jgi:aryl-alcohol dehydrogenase-like predicted oxidoreductase